MSTMCHLKDPSYQALNTHKPGVGFSINKNSTIENLDYTASSVMIPHIEALDLWFGLDTN